MHTSQLVLPLSGWYVPTKHGVHVACFSSALYVPGAHAVCSVLPVGAKWPASVSSHWSGCFKLLASEYVPEGHGSGAAEPSEQ